MLIVLKYSLRNQGLFPNDLVGKISFYWCPIKVDVHLQLGKERRGMWMVLRFVTSDRRKMKAKVIPEI
jgi:hypothetical protein